MLLGQTEQCIVARRGKPIINIESHSATALFSDGDIHRTIELDKPAGRRKHSHKPEEFYKLVEELCPGLKLELFARREREERLGTQRGLQEIASGCGHLVRSL